MMKSKQQQAAALEDELLSLNALVRKRRAQLARLEECPNKTCECRAVWREHVEKNLARQVGKIRRHVAPLNGKAEPKPARAKSRARG